MPSSRFDNSSERVEGSILLHPHFIGGWNMAIVFYVDGATRTITTSQPDITGKALVEVILPEGMPLSFLINQLNSLNQNISSPANAQAAAIIIIKVTYGN